MKQFRFLLLASCSIAVLIPAVAGAVVIDSFTGAQALKANAGAASVTSFVSNAGILGGERDLIVQYLNGPGDSKVDIVDIATTGVFTFVTGDDTSGRGGIGWDGVDGSSTFNHTGLGGVDLTGGGALNSLAIEVLLTNQPVDLLFTIFTDSGHSSNKTVNLPGNILAPQTIVVPFSSFAPVAGGGANFSSVGGISMGFFPSGKATLLKLDGIQTVVPEPASVTLLAVGLAALVGWVCRTKQRAAHLPTVA